MYKADLSDWFFCETKGPRDSLSEGQREKFAQIWKVTGKPIRLLQFIRAPH